MRRTVWQITIDGAEEPYELDEHGQIVECSEKPAVQMSLFDSEARRDVHAKLHLPQPGDPLRA
ncbi:MAG: hypothetical protein HYY96_09420 [Candidatus Tectomicrobia bacterium]|nr:hypothetical protein [Candidatus Tectomicrobia bacterium]